MSSKINSPSLPIPHRLPTNSPSFNTSSNSLRFKCRPHSVPSSSYTSPSRQESLDKVEHGSNVWDVRFETLEGCKLGISWYPDFEYNAKGGIGTAIGRKEDEARNDDDTISVTFDVGTLYIPPLTGATTKFLGLPLPPFLKIDIVPESFQGTISKESGKADLQFRAKFWFSVGSIYKAPPLMVETTLTSEESTGKLRAGRGERINGEGRCRLVGVALVNPINDILMNSFLGLPSECIADLNARISITSST
ncbi:uncharacterized protein LOC103702626 [Phoenix dactylifera]|uniref:Uncharacterized protein LOC103702626 n=1 Tax=Phoenix dactylifera TaxID=42345 RepID=A0A8B8J2D6_PHODC|nr:uncharacterized protein LOC103702626 [Phoenix dactylifera]XP_026658636.1 uncharacterized protein LOC103702626 [Phoenix dactylifera]